MKKRNQATRKIKPGRNSLLRQVNELLELNILAKREIEKWLGGFVEVSARLYMANKDDEFVKGLPESTYNLVMDKVKEMKEKQ